MIGYEGLNLVPLDVTLEEPVLFFYNRAKLVRTVSLRDLYQRKSELHRTASHFEWVLRLELNGSNQLRVELVDGKTLTFSLKSGQRVSGGT